MREMIKPTIALFIICFFVALSLSFVNSLTKNTIASMAEEKSKEQRIKVMDNANSFKKVKDWKNEDQSKIINEVYSAYNKNELSGYVFEVIPSGYAGDIKITIGIDLKQKISGVIIGESNETPGLGLKASDENFLKQYFKKSIDEVFEVVKTSAKSDNEIESISGATITSTAVTDAVQAASDLGNILLEKGGSK
ncbi:MAG: RnfABCDGE type electron transport complex subunit G [Clostridiales bacterium]